MFWRDYLSNVDQKRIVHLAAGNSSWREIILVVGRAITAAPDRVAAAYEVLQDLVNAEKVASDAAAV